MNVAQINKDTLPLALSWWEDRGGTAPVAEMLPPGGFIVEDICAGWLYLSDSVLSHYAWTVGNPAKSPKVTLKGFEVLINGVKEYAEASGCPLIFAYTNHHGLLKLYQKHGFQLGDRNVNHLMYPGSFE